MLLGDRRGGRGRYDRRGEKPVASGVYFPPFSALEQQSSSPVYVDSYLYSSVPPAQAQQSSPLGHRDNYSNLHSPTPPAGEERSPPPGYSDSGLYPPTSPGREQQHGPPPPSLGYSYNGYICPPPPPPPPPPPEKPAHHEVPAAGLDAMVAQKNSTGADVRNETIGFHQLHPPNKDEGDDAQIDIIAIHGLAEDAFSAWTEPNSGVLWLRDLLPQYLLTAHPEIRSRVSSFGYQSGMFARDAYEHSARLLTFSEQLLNHLADSQRKSPDGFYRPILFVCHSLGGLVVKDALNLAFNKPSQYPGIVDNTKSIIFLATPHAGADLTVWARLLGRLSIGLKLNPKSSDDFKTWSGTLMDLATNFVHRAPKLKITTFFENDPLGGQVVVDEGSARMNLENERTVSLDADHLSICRFANRSDNVAITVLRRIKRTAEEIVAEVAAEKALQKAAAEKARKEASELLA
ncbi:hypothetical protein DFP73DRAFT_569347 [Morchella snyderi]|nr:hypothetical protein DFP73DRAFT_569347 [Morchella snyderi]